LPGLDGVRLGLPDVCEPRVFRDELPADVVRLVEKNRRMYVALSLLMSDVLKDSTTCRMAAVSSVRHATALAPSGIRGAQGKG
jgi:hypothetical protein